MKERIKKLKLIEAFIQKQNKQNWEAIENYVIANLPFEKRLELSQDEDLF